MFLETPAVGGVGSGLAGPAAPFPVGSGDLSSASVTILNAASISGAIDLGNYRLHHIVLPAAWTTAAVGFDVSHDGITYTPLFSPSGEYSLAATTVVAASRSVLVDMSTFYGIRFLKVRSGIVGAAVAQGADRIITLVTVPR